MIKLSLQKLKENWIQNLKHVKINKDYLVQYMKLPFRLTLVVICNLLPLVISGVTRGEIDVRKGIIYISRGKSGRKKKKTKKIPFQIFIMRAKSWN